MKTLGLVWKVVSLLAIVVLSSCPLTKSPDTGEENLEPEIRVTFSAAEIVSGGVVECGSTVRSTSTDYTFSIENQGTDELQLNGSPRVEIVGTDPFLVTVFPNLHVSPGQSTTFTVQFAPYDLGTKAVTVNIANNDSDENPYTFWLIGTAVISGIPEMRVTHSDTGEIPDDSGIFSFADTPIGDNNDANFTIANWGDVDLNLTDNPKVQIEGDDAAMFEVTYQPYSPVSPGGNASFTLRFSPTNLGSKSATLNIPNNDPDKNPYNFALAGTGILVPDIIIPGIDDGWGRYHFSDLLLGSFADATFTIENAGDGDLNLTGDPKVQIGGADASMFTVISEPPATVPSLSSSTFTIRFAPTSIGAKSATVSIPNNDPDENPYDFGLYARATNYDTIVDSEGGQYSSIAVSGSNIYICHYHDNFPDRELKFAKSTDGGITWPVDNIKVVDSTGYGGKYTSITTSGNDIYISYYNSDNGDVKFAKSEDEGKTWPTDNIAVVDSVGSLREVNTSIAVSESNVYISYYDPDNGDLKIAKSIDGGETWSTEDIKTVQAEGDVGRYNSVAVSGNDVYISFYDETNRDLKFAKSIDSGTTWPTDNIKTVQSAGWVGAQNSIAVSGSDIYISYQDATSNYKLKFAKSTDGGVTWPTSNIKTVDSSSDGYTSLAVSGNDVYISYSYYDVDVMGSGLKCTKSTDGGATWPIDNIRIVDSNGNVGWSNSIATTGSDVYISYYDMTNNSLKFARSTDGGITW